MTDFTMTPHPLNIDRDPATGIVVLRLAPAPAGSPVVVLNRALLQAINHALDQLKETPPRGLVLASDSRVFIAGADLREVMSLSDADLHDYLRFGQRVYSRIAMLPCTTVAAINGAALGGGLEIAMYCDHLIAAEPAASGDKPAKPYPIGLPEAGLSICPGWGGTNMLPARMDPHRAIRMTATGETFSVVDAFEAKLIEELVAPDQLLARARLIAGRPKHAASPRPPCISDDDRREAARAALDHLAGELPDTQAARAVAECVRIGLEKGWQAALDAERENLVRLRGTPEGRAGIESFFARAEKK
jgi:enoyl-CoA hydratase/carnithine racemase